MSLANKLPPFVVPYSHGESCFHIHSNRTVKAAAAQAWALQQIGETNEDAFLKSFISAFWIIEGFFYHVELVGKDFEGLAYYLECREGLAMPERWKLYNDSLSTDEALILVDIFNSTRRNAFETEIDTPPDEKKSE